MKPQVFLSYSRRDQAFALHLANQLKQRNVPVWVDQWNIPPGPSWEREIQKALQSCTHVLLILSANSVNSKEVLNEMYYASDSGKTILPVICGPCEVPLRIKPLQYVDFTSLAYEAALDKVVNQFFTGHQSNGVPDKEPEFVMNAYTTPAVHQIRAPKQLALSSDHRWIAGVLGGLGDYLGMSPMFLRIVFIALAIFTSGVTLILYPVLWWWMARKT